jgi:hypothetical protein
MAIFGTPITVVDGCTPDNIPQEVLDSTSPLILKGLVANWPIVHAGKKSVKQADAYIRQFYNQLPIVAYCGKPEIKGRIFYNEDMSGFNFNSGQYHLDVILDNLLECLDNPEPPLFYIGSTMVDNWLPGFRKENDLIIGAYNPLVSIWVGNKNRIPAHYDFPDNIACSVVGRRRFTLFPPEQLQNLYIGPIDLTPSGQPISLVDFANPDFEHFPRFQEAIKAAQVAELDAGDAIFIPSMWWHHVESLENYNVLVNYWWRKTPAWLGNPTDVLYHALMALRDLPVEQRDAWGNLFKHYVFNSDASAVDHIPEARRGVLAPLDEQRARNIRMQLLNRLNRK